MRGVSSLPFCGHASISRQHGDVARRHSSYPYAGDDRHSDRWYDQSGEAVVLSAGDRFFIPCDGGPSTSRLEVFPPRLEIEENDGMYVLEDDGPRDAWRYVFVPREL
jgi:hypothetical protein